MPIHVPDLAAIAALNDPEVRFFAAMGALVSLNAGIEHLEFDVFQKGTGLPEETAARIFFSVRNDRARAQMATLAMDYRTEGDAALSARWQALCARLLDKTTRDARNLVSHNPATAIAAGSPIGLTLVFTHTHPLHLVRQDPRQIQFGDRKEMAAGFSNIHDAAKRIATLIPDLESFLAALL